MNTANVLLGEKPVRSGSLEDGRVLSGSAALSLRPVESLALSGGIAWRNASYTFAGDRTGSEQSLRPFLGLQLLY